MSWLLGWIGKLYFAWRRHRAPIVEQRVQEGSFLPSEPEPIEETPVRQASRQTIDLLSIMLGTPGVHYMRQFGRWVEFTIDADRNVSSRVIDGEPPWAHEMRADRNMEGPQQE